MDISFAKGKLGNIFKNDESVRKHYGLCAEKIFIRLEELENAKTLNDLAPPYSKPARCHELKLGDRKGKFHISVDVKHPYRLIFTPNHNPIPILPDGGLDWKCVTAITIIAIEDTHD